MSKCEHVRAVAAESVPGMSCPDCGAVFRKRGDDADADVTMYTKARNAARAAAQHADQLAADNGFQLGDGLWDDAASDHLYDQRTAMPRSTYTLARELLGEQRRERFAS